jgi:SAM-dependent methyltransferase
MTMQNDMPDFLELDIDEPLAESAWLAMDWSKTLCRDCAAYHGAWQVLRVLGVLNSMRSDDDFLVSRLHSEMQRGARKILISGAADYALQARIMAVARYLDIIPEITVIDLCETPLALNTWYATRAGTDIETVKGNILEYRNAKNFDLVCTHSFLPFFSPAERTQLLRSWWNCLNEGGAVITAQRVRPHEKSERHGFSDRQAQAFGERAFELAEENFNRLNIEPAYARRLAHDYAAGRSTYALRSRDELKLLFEQCGFTLDWFAAPGEQQTQTDLPSTPTRPGDQRIRILARKPVLKPDNLQ